MLKKWNQTVRNCSSLPIKVSVCSSAGHITAVFTIMSKLPAKHKEKRLALTFRILDGNILAAFCFTKKRTQEIAIAINLGWPYQGWYCISFPLSEILILAIHVTLAHFNFMFSYDSKLSRFPILKTAHCYAMIYRNMSSALKKELHEGLRQNADKTRLVYKNMKSKKYDDLSLSIWLPICRKAHSIQIINPCLISWNVSSWAEFPC